MRSEDLNKIRQMKLEQIIKLRKNDFKVEIPVAKGDKPVDVQEAENIKKNGNPQATIDFADYPWDQCIADQLKTYGDKAIAEAVCGAIKAQNMNITPNPCWDGYEPIGLKDDGTPNCVPIKASKEDFVIPDPSGDEDEQTFISRCVSAIYNEYGDSQSYAICKSKWDEK